MIVILPFVVAVVQVFFGLLVGAGEQYYWIVGVQLFIMFAIAATAAWYVADVGNQKR